MPQHYHIRGTSAKQIAESLERSIDAGVFAPGSRLPTIRELSTQLGVSPTTVNAAFARLRADGRISGNRRGGSTVVGRPILQSAGVHAPPAAAHDLAQALPDPALLPRLASAFEGVPPKVARSYGARSERLEGAAAAWLAQDRIDASHVMIASGAGDAIERALQAHLNPGDTVAIEELAYPSNRRLAEALRLRVVPLALDERGVRPEALEAALRAGARALVVVPRAHNPTGASFDAKRRRALRAVLRDSDVLTIEDDYLSEVAMSSLHALAGATSRWLYVRGTGKILGPDLRVAIAAGDAITVARMRARQTIASGWVSTLLQDVVARLLEDTRTAHLWQRARTIYAKRRDALLAAVRDAGFEASGDDGFCIWVRVPDESSCVAGLLARGWAVDGGARYGATTPHLRVVSTRLEPADARRFASDLLAVAGADALRP